MAATNDPSPTLQGLLGTMIPGGEPSQSEQTLRPEAGSPAGADAVEALVASLSPLEQEVELGEPLGEGGMGLVRLGLQRALAREVAIKSINPAARPESARRAILLEAWAASALEHPHIVPVHTLATDPEGQPHLIMRRVTGQTWSRYLARPDAVRADFGVRDVLAWHLGVLMAVCNAIAFAHSRGVLHRDLKPDNVMIGRYGEVWVLDWGLAVRLDNGGPGRLPRASEDTRLVGTPRYMAPEMARKDAAALSERTDVYLLGGLLYTILTGQGPHPGHGVEETLAAIPHFRAHLPPGTPPRLQAIVRQALAAEPERRFPSAAALRAALQAFLEEREADELVARAMADVDRLVDQLGQSEPDPTRLHRLFGAARFGLLRAQESVPDHPLAREGLRRALLAMASWELSRRDPGAASVYLDELPDPPSDLLAQRDALQEELRREREQAQALLASVDSRTGRRSRSLIFGLMALGWTLIPLWAWISGGFEYRRLLDGHVPLFALSLALLVWARRSMGATAVNRNVSRALVVMQAQLLGSLLLGSVLGLSAHQVVVLQHLMLCAGSVLLMGVYGSLGLLPALAYALTAALGAVRPEWLAPLSTGANGLVGLMVLRQSRRRRRLGVG